MGWKKGEKYFKADAVIIREVNGLKIVFYDKESIYVRDADGRWVVFHRWFTPRGTYNADWRPFRYKMLYQKNLTLNRCYQIAFQHDIVVQSSGGVPDLSKSKIQVRF